MPDIPPKPKPPELEDLPDHISPWFALLFVIPFVILIIRSL